MLLSPVGAWAADATPGEAIYNQQCVRCHGQMGVGTKKAPQPIIGGKSLPQLTRVVKETMPESDPGSLTDAQARDVTTYIYHAFYSPEAQAKINPPRVDLARLTVAQYRNSIADLIASFRPTPFSDKKQAPQQGLRGEYYASRDFRTDRRQIDRVDPEVQFDFGGNAPQGGKDKDAFNAQQYCVRWEGSVLAPDTGMYDFVVRSDHAVRLFVNDIKTPIIDAMIKSGDTTEFRGSIQLLGGRSYNIRLEFSKGRQLGVQALQKAPPPVPAFVKLAWKAPHRPEQIIPARYLSPGKSVEQMVISTPFPPDDRSYGWERGTTISKEWLSATANASMEVAGYVGTRLNELAGTNDAANDRAAKLKTFATTFVERAFRRPLNDAEKTLYIDSQFKAVTDPAMAVKRVVLLALSSPRFLYPAVADAPEGYEAASRLSYTLWDSPPDKQLLEAAAQGKLKTADDIRRQAERMLSDPRARAKIREFMMVWLHTDHWPDLMKDPKRFPQFDPQLADDLRTSLELTLEDIIWSDSSDYRQLMLSEEVYLNGRLSQVYGGGLPKDAGFQKVRLDSGKRAGVITHPYILASLAYTAESSPIHRGVFLSRGILGVSLRPPAEAITPFPADKHPDLTTRQRVALQTSAAACAGCHGMVNPLGFTLENFDAIGRIREKENGKPIDATGYYETRAGPIVKFNGATSLSKYLAESEDARGSFVVQLFQHMVKQSARAYGIAKPDELRQTFEKQGYNVKKMITEVAVLAAMPPPQTASAGR